MEEKIPVIRLKKAAREKLANQMGIAIGAYLLQLAIAAFAFVVIAMALSGTVLAPLMQQLMNVTDEMSLIEAEKKLFDMTNTPRYIVTSELISAFMGALFATLSTGYIRICLKISRTEKPSIKDLFYVYKNNPDRVILIYLLTFLVQFFIGLPGDQLAYYVQKNPDNTGLYLVYMAVLTLSMVVTVIFALAVSQTFFIYVDDPSVSVIDVFKQSVLMMKGNKGRLFSLAVSFLGWLGLCILTCGTLTIWVVPYIEMTMTEFYRTTKGELLWVSKSNYQGPIDSEEEPHIDYYL